MADKIFTITLELSPRALKLLKEVNDAFIAPGGPVWECAQEWDEPYDVETINELHDEIKHGIEMT